MQLVTSFLLKAENSGTVFTIHESGYEHIPPEERQAWLDAAGGGYAGSVENLKALVEGTPLPHPAQARSADQLEPMSVERSIWIEAPQEQVWRAITEVKHINHWWGGDYWEIAALEVGATVKFGDPEDLMLAAIAVLDAPREFSLQWPPQEQYHSIAMFTTYRLEEENGGTRVTVTETGLEALPDEIRQQRIDSTAQGYATVLADMKAYVERSDF
jgi:uncharacterized protein YndB with AHSA1/START domain